MRVHQLNNFYKEKLLNIICSKKLIDDAYLRLDDFAVQGIDLISNEA